MNLSDGLGLSCCWLQDLGYMSHSLNFLGRATFKWDTRSLDNGSYELQ